MKRNYMIIAGISREDDDIINCLPLKKFIAFVDNYNLSIETINTLFNLKEKALIANPELGLIRNELRRVVLDKLINTPRYFISFEGVDATGKGTISRFFESFIQWLDIKAERINIPNYTLGTGKIITNALSTNMTEEDLYKRRYEFINHFAVNRKEVNYNYRQEYIKLESKVFIFDRWINSSVAFSIAKTILHTLPTDNEGCGVDGVVIPEIFTDDIINQIKEAIDYNYNLELDILGNDVVDLELVIVSSIENINKRIDQRKNTSSQDQDIIKDDQHEKNSALLQVTQKVFESLAVGHLNNINYENRAAKSTFVIENDYQLKEAIFDCLKKFLD